MNLTAKQSEAVDACLKNRVTVITGGAGSGKTTVIKNIIERLNGHEPDGNVVLAAPTGKAAARITEATGYKARTLHSACGVFPVDGSDDLGRQETPPPASRATTLIVDEGSMTDDSLLAAVATTVPGGCRVVLVGDPNQLPPVGAGYPFRDLINSKRVPHVHLDVCHRQTGSLLRNCYQILDGNPNGLITDPGKGNRRDADWAVIQCGDDAITPALAHIFTAGTCDDSFGIPPEELLVLTPVNKGDAGRIQLNRAIQKSYHESRGRLAPTYKDEGERDQFVVGDRVIWCKNSRILELVNGDTGVVVSVGKDSVVVDWDGQGRKTVEACIKLQLAWALTCHKAQGSQYRKVLVVQSGKHAKGRLSHVINRSWLYTAATRSKEATFFLGSAAAFVTHVKTPVVDVRQTYLSYLASKA